MFQEKSIRDVLYGVAAADALGAPFEFSSRQEIRYKPIHMQGGSNKLMTLEAGQWTDDTELTLRLAETLALGLPLDLHLLARSYIDWAKSGPPDIGTTTAAALQEASGLENARSRARNFHQVTGHSAGNGTIMRAAPLAFLPLGDKELFQVAQEEATITHWAQEAREASFLQALAIRQLLRGQKVNLPLDNAQPLIREAVQKSNDKDYVCRVVAEGGSAWSSLAAALWSLQYSNFEEGVRAVVRLGHDTDTNAACAGALLAARRGGIPEEWIEPLWDRPRIERAISGLVKIQR